MKFTRFCTGDIHGLLNVCYCHDQAKGRAKPAGHRFNAEVIDLNQILVGLSATECHM